MGMPLREKRQFVVNQEDQNTMIAFYTPDGESLYLTSYKLTADTTVNDLTWTSLEQYGKSEGANDEKIAKEKQGILDELKEIKNLIYIANKVVPLTFSAENYTDPFAQEFYRESIKANVDDVVYTYEFYYAAKDMADGNGSCMISALACSITIRSPGSTAPPAVPYAALGLLWRVLGPGACG